jgi:hypothetical protein
MKLFTICSSCRPSEFQDPFIYTSIGRVLKKIHEYIETGNENLYVHAFDTETIEDDMLDMIDYAQISVLFWRDKCRYHKQYTEECTKLLGLR